MVPIVLDPLFHFAFFFLQVSISVLTCTWLPWFHFSSQLLALSSFLGTWWLILTFLLSTFGFPLKMGDVHLLAFSISGCSEVLTLLSQVLIPGPFLSFDLFQWHLCWAWLLQMRAWARGKVKQGNRKDTWLNLNYAGHWGLEGCTLSAF